MDICDRTDFFEVITKENSVVEKFDALYFLAQEIGFSDIFYCTVQDETNGTKWQKSNTSVLRRGCPQWMETYEKEGFARIDWAVEKAIWARGLYRLNEIPANLTEKQITFVGHAKEHKRNNGFCIPFRGPNGLRGGFSANGFETIPPTNKISQLAAAAHYFDLQMQAYDAELTRAEYRLSKREHEQLMLLVNGRSMAQIAHLNGKTEQWIRLSFMQMREKFGVSSNSEMIYKAASLKLI